MKTAYQLTLALISILLATSPATAKQATSALYSPGCDQEQLKKIAGDALINISKNQKWGNDTEGYIVTLETDNMSFADLAKEMHKAGCFKAKDAAR